MHLKDAPRRLSPSEKARAERLVARRKVEYYQDAGDYFETTNADIQFSAIFRREEDVRRAGIPICLNTNT